MSWILGFSGRRLSPALRARLAALHPAATAVAEGAGHYLAAGGLPETCCCGTLPDGASWAVAGLGIRRQADGCTFLGPDEWRALLAPQEPAFDGLDGHFAAVRVRPGEAACFTDAPGTRTLYLTTLPEGAAFSTRLDWLATLRGDAAIDFEAFGGHWLCSNQLTTEGLVRGIRRLGPDGRARCTAQGIRAADTPWTPPIRDDDADGAAFAQTLTAFAHPRTGRTLSLGLSGGLDSRLLLALRMDEAPVHTHVFGPDDHPDVRVAGHIADGEGLAHRRFHQPVPDADACLALLRDHAAQTHALYAASAVLGLRYYPALHAERVVMIDGGLGGTLRRQSMNRLLHQGRTALRSGDPDAILPYLRVPRADVFNAEATAAMERGFRRQIETAWQTPPGPLEIGDENFLDLLGVRTRLPNFFGYEQSRLDGVLPNYMPFAQPALLRAAFLTPLALRRDGRLFRRLILARRPSLARYPLVTGGVTYPFGLSTAATFVWTRVKRRLGGAFTDPARLRFLERLKPFALDALHSQAVRSYAAYDQGKLARLVEGFYGGAEDLAGAVDWWLAFELWRRALRV